VSIIRYFSFNGSGVKINKTKENHHKFFEKNIIQERAIKNNRFHLKIKKNLIKLKHD